MKPTIGRIVLVKLSDSQRDQIKNHSGHGGNNGADLSPAVIVRVWSDTCVNLKVIGDGVNDLWLTSIVQGDQNGQWQWPPRV